MHAAIDVLLAARDAENAFAAVANLGPHRATAGAMHDPLSALDVDTEARVEAGLRRVLATTTALVVAHRPSTVQLADRVALLENGRITAVGTHSELLATNDHYRYVISSLDVSRQARQPDREARDQAREQDRDEEVTA